MNELDITISELKMLVDLPSVDEAIKEPVQKAIAFLTMKKPRHPRIADGDVFCPECGQCLCETDDMGAYDFCFSCGQAIDNSID